MDHVGTKGRLPSPSDLAGWVVFKFELDRRRRDALESNILSWRRGIASGEKDIERLQLLDENKQRTAYIQKLQNDLVFARERLAHLLSEQNGS
jgi:hypothetical protein